MTRSELSECLRLDRAHTLGNVSKLHMMYSCIIRHPAWLRWKYIKYMRLSNYYSMPIKALYERKKNIIGNKIGFEIGGEYIGKGLGIFHNGPVVIHCDARIGKNCSLHGDNCIGNNGLNNLAPTIGDNVDIGVGAKIVGNVHIADGIKVGAGAVVVDSFDEPGISIGGVPAKKLT